MGSDISDEATMLLMEQAAAGEFLLLAAFRQTVLAQRFERELRIRVHTHTASGTADRNVTASAGGDDYQH